MVAIEGRDQARFYSISQSSRVSAVLSPECLFRPQATPLYGGGCAASQISSSEQRLDKDLLVGNRKPRRMNIAFPLRDEKNSGPFEAMLTRPDCRVN